MGGVDELCVKAYGKALEVIPYTLAENAGLKPIDLVTELRNKHNSGLKSAGVDVKRVSDTVSNDHDQTGQLR